MPATTAPQTLAIGNALVAYLAALTYPDTTPVYINAQLELTFDIANRVNNSGVAVEVYGGADDSERRGFGGRIWDEQEWLILSLCSLETATLAKQIYKARDALVQPLQQHAELGGTVTNLFHAQIKPKSGHFGTAVRNGFNYKMHMISVITRAEWYLPLPPGVTT